MAEVKVQTNFEAKSAEIQKFASQLSKKYLKAAMFYWLNEIGNKSVAEFMIPTTSVEQAISAPVAESLLTVRSGRLARSVLEAPSFNRAGLDRHLLDVKRVAKPAIPPSEEGVEGSKRVIISGTTVDGIIISDVPYAHRHEVGWQMPKRSFLQPAAEASMDIGKEIFRKTIEGSWGNQRI